MCVCFISDGKTIFPPPNLKDYIRPPTPVAVTADEIQETKDLIETLKFKQQTMVYIHNHNFVQNIS